MSTHRTILACAALLLICTTAASFAPPVKTDYDRNIDFTRYKTYSWERVQAQNSLWVDRIKTAVNKDLAAKGWTCVSWGGDVAIVALEMSREYETLEAFYNGYGGGWRWRGFGDATMSVETYKVGTLIVDLFDGHSKMLIWRGSSSDTLSDKSDKNIKTLDKAVQKMFEHFPPGEKK
jgi:hypothetical protein